MQHLTIYLYCRMCRSGDAIPNSEQSAARWDPATAAAVQRRSWIISLARRRMHVKQFLYLR
jgi:hypothetical protein